MTNDERDALRYRWWRENADLLTERTLVEIAYDFQVPMHGIDKAAPVQSEGDLMDAIADRGIASHD